MYNLSSLNITKGSSGYGYVALYAQEIHTSLDEPSIYGEINGFLFMNTGTPQLIGYTGKETSITLPDDYKGENYTIAANAFTDCTNLTSVTIGKGVSSIGSKAFGNCSSLISVTWNAKKCNNFSSNYPFPATVKSITFGDEVEKIPACLCYNMTGLTSITIPSSVTSIGSSAFSGCSGLTSIKVDAANKYYDSRSNCNAIINSSTNELFVGCKNTIIPNTVTSIGGSAFDGCSGLTSVTIPNSVTSIGQSAFSSCSGLTSVTIGSGVTSIERNAFYDCIKLYEVYNLSSLDLIRGLMTNGYVAYYAKVIHTSSDEPSSYEEVNGFQFMNLSTPQLIGYTGNETSITLPNDYKGKNYIIADKAFYGCFGLSSVTIPSSVASIGNYAFSGCSGLTSVVWNAKKCNDLSSSNFSFPTTVENITFGDEVEYIPAYLCCNMTGLTSVTIPSSVTSFGINAFSGCTGIKDIINLSSYPQTITSSSRIPKLGLPTTATVHVLNGCKGVYSASSVWNIYNIVDDAGTFFPLENVSFEKDKRYMKIGSVFKLTPMIEPSNVPASFYDLIWMTSDPSVLYYDQSTQRFMAMKEGTATVTVTAIDANENVKTAQVTVYVGESYMPICANPVVTFADGEILCVSETESATCHYEYEITTPSGSGEKGCKLSPKLIVKAYAIAEEHRDSETITKTFDLNAGSGLKGDVNGDGKVTMADANEVVNIYLGK